MDHLPAFNWGVTCTTCYTAKLNKKYIENKKINNICNEYVCDDCEKYFNDILEKGLDYTFTLKG